MLVHSWNHAKLYLIYREHGAKHSSTPPPSFLVFHQVYDLCCLLNNNLVQETLKSRVQLSEVDKMRIADQAVKDAENALREDARAKRQRTQ